MHTTEKQSEQEIHLSVIGTIGGHPITPLDLISTLRHSLQWSQLTNAAKARFLTALYDEHAIPEPSEKDVEPQIDRFRRANKLYTAKETELWLEANFLKDEDLVSVCAKELRLQMLKERLFASKVEESFALNKLALERVELYRIVVADQGEAEELKTAIDEGAEFVALAKEHNEDEHGRRTCGYMGISRRKQLRPEIEASVCSAKPGTVVGPIKSLGRYHLYLIEQFYPAKLDEVCHQFLLDELFTSWFEERFRQANLTWLI